MKHISIAIDGPAGAGKSTIARQIAKELGFIYVDTGAMYRAMALYFIRNDIDSSDSKKIEEACPYVNVSIEYKDGEQLVILNGENVNGLIRTEAVGNMASAASINKSVRLKLVELQQDLAKKANVVMDGRDIGTYVLPGADLKIYLTASTKERARRRWAELKEKGIDADMNEIEKDIESRDFRDMNREFAPLKQAEDAIYVDTSNLTIDEVIQKILLYYQKINQKRK
ncbi:(d)CMP kinase [Mobilitalea sibirica]|uniref:Cytidylate kinase n=1 Tax=Mobilitalea sibirica TaxID=1462919 RepID=A0A8J7HCI1_9FIRM|nr:(d)CMP kinase [Mobilitalea sibirica]MBH1942380.1 (d)CMP kinase [Mobilitalea sibirica]